MPAPTLIRFALGCLLLTFSGCTIPAARFYNVRGLNYYRKAEYDLALADFDKAIKLAPWFAEPYTNRGLIEDIKGDYAHAIADHDQAIRLNPRLAIAFN